MQGWRCQGLSIGSDMKQVERQKMCPHCDASIPLDAEICPFCSLAGATVKTENPYEAPLFDKQSLEESLASLYTPPYSGRRYYFSEENKGAKEPQPAQRDFAAPLEQEPSPEALPKEGHLLTTILMTAASQLLVLGLLQLFLSSNGKLVLEWDATYCFAYLLGAGLLGYFGVRRLRSDGSK